MAQRKSSARPSRSNVSERIREVTAKPSGDEGSIPVVEVSGRELPLVLRCKGSRCGSYLLERTSRGNLILKAYQSKGKKVRKTP